MKVTNCRFKFGPRTISSHKCNVFVYTLTPADNHSVAKSEKHRVRAKAINQEQTVIMDEGRNGICRNNKNNRLAVTGGELTERSSFGYIFSYS